MTFFYVNTVFNPWSPGIKMQSLLTLPILAICFLCYKIVKIQRNSSKYTAILLIKTSNKMCIVKMKMVNTIWVHVVTLFGNSEESPAFISKHSKYIRVIEGTLSSDDDDDAGENVRKTIVLISRTLAVHVRYKLWYISLPSNAKQRREMTINKVFWRTSTPDD